MAHDVANEDPGNFVPMFAIWLVIVLALLVGRFVTFSLRSDVEQLVKRVEALEAKQ